MIHRTHLIGPALALSFVSLLSAREGGQVPARFGLQQLEDRFGRTAIRQVVEMTGTAGDPQPKEWRVTATAPGRSDLLREFWIGEGRVTEEGLSDDFYPDRIPKGFLSLGRLKLDSTQAFAMAEQVARDAGVGFDVINYKLHCREYTDEPVWTLTLLDREETIVGSVHLSADSGRLLRTVWLRRQPNGRLAVEDSGRGDRPTPPVAAPEIAGPEATLSSAEDPTEPAEPEAIETTDSPPPAPDPNSPEPAPVGPAPAEPEPTTEDGEIPEIKKLQEAQDKAGGAGQ